MSAWREKRTRARLFVRETSHLHSFLAVLTLSCITKTPTPSTASPSLDTASPTETLIVPDETGTISGSEDFVVTRQITVDNTCGTIEGLGDLAVEICLVADSSGSFEDDLPNLIAASEQIYQSITSRVQRARFGVASFIDYPIDFAYPSVYPYRVNSPMSPNIDSWLSGVQSIQIENNQDVPESQYDAIVGAAQGLQNDYVDQPDCGWSTTGNFERIMVVTTDATFHVPQFGGPYENDFDSTLAVLNRDGIRVVGLEAFGSGTELDRLAAATGGSVEPLSRDGSDIASAILSGIEALPCRVLASAVGCDPLTVTFDPPSQVVDPGSSLTIDTTFSANSNTPVGLVVLCEVVFTANLEVVGSMLVEVTVTD